MAINDKLKGSYYRVPMTKLASRTAIMNQFNELITYFNSLNDMLSNSFGKVTTTREYSVGLLEKMQTTIIHFNYLLENYKSEIDVHIAEKLSTLISTFTSSFNNLLEDYNVNLFNHSKVSDDYSSNYTRNDANNLEEWDKSVSMNATDLGIRWFGGKFTDQHVITEINNVFHIVKINTYDGKINEDVINSNPILELFIRTPKGMTWLVLGQNGSLGYNIITKYQSQKLISDIKIATENYFNPKTYDINQFDINLFVKALLTQDDVDGSNVYIKVKTNIPSNTESGREGYFISTNKDGSTKLDDLTELKSITNASKKLLYEDNKDIKVAKRDDSTLKEINSLSPAIKVDTEEIVNPVLKREYVETNPVSAKMKPYYANIKNKLSSNKNISFDNTTFNPNNDQMSNMMDTIDGRVTHHETIVDVENPFYGSDFDNSNKECNTSSDAKYFKGQQIEDLFDYRNVGKVNLLPKNENMFETDGDIESSNTVIQNDSVYEENINDKTIVNRLYNNSIFDSLSNTDYIERKFRVLNQITESYKINCIVKTNKLGTLIGTTKGIYVVDNNKGFILPSSNIGCIIEYNNTVYIGTLNNDGIYYWDDNTNAFVHSNIIGNNIRTFVVAKKPNSDTEETLYAFASNSSYITNTDLGRYDLQNFYYVLYPSGWLSDHDLSAQILNNSTDPYRVETQVIAKGMTDSNTDHDQEYKIIYNSYLKKWYILNIYTGFVASTDTDKLLNFKKSEITEKFGAIVKDIIYKDQKLYIAIESADKTVSEVYKYDGTTYDKIEYYNYTTKNDRKVVEKFVILNSLASITK